MKLKQITNSEVILKCFDKIEDKFNKDTIELWKRAIENIKNYKEVNGVPDIEVKDTYPLIFSHDFAKALWGEKPMDSGVDWHSQGMYIKVRSKLKEYQYHLQELALAKDPIKYLEKFI